jgi:hypothetical protein
MLGGGCMLCAIMVLYDRLLMHQRRSTRTLIRDCSAQWAELFVNHHFNQPGRLKVLSPAYL